MENNRLVSTVGLCRRAGKTVLGSDLVCKALRRKELFLVLLASDASDNTKKRIRDKTSFYKVSLAELPLTCDELGRSVGKMGGVACVGVADDSFSKALQKQIELL